MSAPVSVRKVESKRDFETFLKFPWALYKGDPSWVPPLVSQMRHKLDRKLNPSWAYMEVIISCVARRAAGRTIAAFINHRTEFS